MTHSGERPFDPASVAKRILIVDDEPILLDMLLDIFHDEGFAVYVAINAEEALELLTRETVDVVLTDFMMPTLSGVELAQRIRFAPATAHIPVVLMSAAKPIQLDSAVTIAIAKPFMIEELVQKVRQVVQ